MELLYAAAGSPFIVSAALIFMYMVWVFLLSLYLQSNGIVDVAYGLGFILVAATLLWNFGPHRLGGVALALVSIWGLRLAIRIHERGRGKPEDFRYAAWRRQWTWFKTRSFFQIYMLQGAVIYVISLPVMFAVSYAAFPLWPLAALGLCVWIAGFVFEAVGDYQLDAFIKNPANRGTLMQSGLWNYTRHPNYFGEATMWWGMWLLCLPAIVPYGALAIALTLVSPVLITFLLLKVSGVPLLEKAMSSRPGWQEYAARVPMFVPRLWGKNK